MSKDVKIRKGVNIKLKGVAERLYADAASTSAGRIPFHFGHSLIVNPNHPLKKRKKKELSVKMKKKN